MLRPYRPCRSVVSLALAAVLGAPFCQGAEPLPDGKKPGPRESIIASDFETRQQVKEWSEEIAAKSRPMPQLFEAALGLIRDRGGKVVAWKEEYLPVSEVIVRHLTDLGLQDSFISFCAPRAQKDLEALGKTPSVETLSKIARQYPGTQTAQSAWRELSDRAWDQGDLQIFIHAGSMVETKQFPADGLKRWNQRLSVAMELMTQKQNAVPVQDLSNPLPLWRVDLSSANGSVPEPATDTNRVVINGRRFFRGRNLWRQANQGTPLSLPLMTPVPGGHMAVSSAEMLQLVDPMLGSRCGEAISYGLGSAQALRPCIDVLSGKIVAGAWSGDRIRLVAMDAHGKKLWSEQQAIQVDEYAQPQYGDPIICGKTIVVPVNLTKRDGVEVRVLGLDLASGHQIWSTTLGLIALDQRNRWGGEDQMTRPPIVVLSGGRILLLSNAGLIGQVDPDGSTRRVIPYKQGTMKRPIFSNDFDENGRMDHSNRSGAILSCDAGVLIAPADSQAFYLLKPDSQHLESWEGEACDGQPLLWRDGVLYVLKRHVFALDTNTRALKWKTSRPILEPKDLSQNRTPAVVSTWSELGPDRLMIAVQDKLLQIAIKDGRSLSEWENLSPAGFASMREVLVVADSKSIAGYGDADRMRSSLEARKTAAPNDPAAYAALASLSAAEGKRVEAFTLLLESLKRGAGANEAAFAARLWRAQFQACLGSSDAQAWLTKGAELEHFITGFQTELCLWKGFLAELAGRSDEAIDAYTRAANLPDTLLTFLEGQSIASSLSASMGLIRLGRLKAPAWLEPQKLSVPRSLSLPGSIDLAGPLLINQTLYAYSGGFLHARDLASRKEIWSQRNAAELGPMLGIRPMADPDRLRVAVIPGSAAVLAGIHDNDVITEFNGQTVKILSDVSTPVVKMNPGDPFTVRIERNGEKLSLSGKLGTRVFLPIAGDEKRILTRRMSIDARGNLVPDPLQADIQVLSARDGSVIWNGVLVSKSKSANALFAERMGEVPQPIIHAEPTLLDDILLLPQGSDLVAVSLDGPSKGKELWKLERILSPGSRLEVRSLQVFSITSPEGAISWREASNGKPLLILSDSQGACVLMGTRAVVQDRDNRLCLWDLGSGRRLWRSEKQGLIPVAASGDGLFVLDVNKRLFQLDAVSGAQRQAYPEWSSVEDFQVSGSLLLLDARTQTRTQEVGAVGLGSGQVQWKMAVPPGTEIHGRILASNERIILGLSGGPAAERSAMILDTKGAIVGSAILEQSDRIHAIGDKVFVLGKKGIEPLVSNPNTTSNVPAVQAPTLPATDNPSLMDALKWRSLGSATFAFARYNQSLVILAQTQPTTSQLIIHLASTDDPIQTEPASIIFRNGTSPEIRGFSTTDQTDPAKPRFVRMHCLDLPNGQRIHLVLIDPAEGLGNMKRFSYRAQCDGHVDGERTPWWLKTAWTPIAQ